MEDEMDANSAIKAAYERKVRDVEDKAIYQLTGGRVVSVEAFARELAEAYADGVGTDVDTNVLRWNDLGPISKSAWEAVAKAAARILSS